MPKIVLPLTPTQIATAKPDKKLFTLFDGKGLFLEVTPQGSKRWRLRYKINGSTKKKSIGSYPEVSLSQARQKRDEARRIIASGIDPFAVIEAEEIKTFRWFTEWYLDTMTAGLSEGHIKQVRAGWANKVLPYIGSKPMSEVTAADIVLIVQRMKDTPATARKVFSTIGNLYSLAIANYPAEVENNPASGIRLKHILQDKPVSYPIITDRTELKRLFEKIEGYDQTKPKAGSVTVKRALLLLPYLFVRPANLREMLWAEIDLEKRVWIIPANKMKSRNEFMVPLPTQVVDMLSDWQLESSSRYVLPSRGGILGSAALSQALHRMGFDIVAHSFRGIASTILNEHSPFSFEVIETSLGHQVGNQVSRAYNRALYLDKRTDLMQWYADYLDDIKKGA